MHIMDKTTTETNDDNITMFVVISAIDKTAHGPFSTRASALAFAQEADGGVFRLVDDGGAA
jgi:hypothetical protein